jgi:hypothetical protein
MAEKVTIRQVGRCRRLAIYLRTVALILAADFFGNRGQIPNIAPLYGGFSPESVKPFTYDFDA